MEVVSKPCQVNGAWSSSLMLQMIDNQSCVGKLKKCKKDAKPNWHHFERWKYTEVIAQNHKQTVITNLQYNYFFIDKLVWYCRYIISADKFGLR
jgi:hypothetical protein